MSTPTMPITLSSPLSMYSIPAVWLTAFLPVTMKTILIQKSRGYNNLEPRQSTSRIATDKGLPSAVAARILRMEGAHLNGYENLPIWIAAVLAGHIAHLDNYTLNVASLLYIGGRIAYNYIYINQATEPQSWARSGVYFGSLSLPMYLLFKAAAKIAASEVVVPAVVVL
ncbi:hypothetical protein DFH08DRAFT_62843 [Mycena albidolilacea]|uniref:Uncharacterized protein n=1 Tax=Mycena albidolilacea TaxID=1033008 RepID=A0AAD7AA69_9AGAR|nr:hypothetical protein DFH08DRAFT_62843 [Mycena albidolilacea]